MTIQHSILKNLCYTELVYNRINKKLGTTMTREEIESRIRVILSENEATIETMGKNYYVTSHHHGIRITINSHTFRVITVDKIKKELSNKVDL